MQDTCTHSLCGITTCMTTMERRQQLAEQGWVRALYRGNCDNCAKTIGQGSMFYPVPVLDMPDLSVAVLDLYFLTLGECCQAEVATPGGLGCMA